MELVIGIAFFCVMSYVKAKKSGFNPTVWVVVTAVTLGLGFFILYFLVLLSNGITIGDIIMYGVMTFRNHPILWSIVIIFTLGIGFLWYILYKVELATTRY
ncbi:MAG: hypothetical protein IJD28_01430 [Deferribacterales bacterium]|nr:hypothetical protein [Deferribacterales bacterium]